MRNRAVIVTGDGPPERINKKWDHTANFVIIVVSQGSLIDGTPEETINAYQESIGSSSPIIIATCLQGQEFEMQKIGWNYAKIMVYIHNAQGIRSV